MSHLSCAVSNCNKGFSEYNFPLITTALYNFWLYELCDVYLEYLKPIGYGGDEVAKAVSKQTEESQHSSLPIYLFKLSCKVNSGIKIFLVLLSFALRGLDKGSAWWHKANDDSAGTTYGATSISCTAYRNRASNYCFMHSVSFKYIYKQRTDTLNIIKRSCSLQCADNSSSHRQGEAFDLYYYYSTG